jgi:thymidylate synthase ThyX
MNEDLTNVRIVKDSIIDGVRVTTLELTYPNIIHPELMTHRVFSRNSASNRAIPFKKIVNNAIFCPIEWPEEQKGMQPKGFIKDKLTILIATLLWNALRLISISVAYLLSKLKVHKQISNRVLGPYLYVTTLVTSTEWENFFNQRIDKNAQHEIYILALKIRNTLKYSTPVKRILHLPYTSMGYDLTTNNGLFKYNANVEYKQYLYQSVARCARVSYKSFVTGKDSTLEEDVTLYYKLITSKPIHASPSEHQVLSKKMCKILFPSINKDAKLNGNFNKKVIQYRKILELL